jgi:hypothetical protein
VCSFGYNRDLQGRLVPGWNENSLAGDYRHAPPPYQAQTPYTFDVLLQTDPVVNSTLLIRRDAVAASGGYPEVMAHQVEDWLLLAKLSLAAPIALIEQPLIDYTIHPGSYSSQYFTQNLAFGVRIEFMLNLVHWMVGHAEYRDQGEQIFRRHYPRLLAAHANAALFLEEFYRRHEGSKPGPAEFEAHLAEVHAELQVLRRFKKRVLSLLGPVRWVPGLEKAIRTLWRFRSHAALRRAA